MSEIKNKYRRITSVLHEMWVRSCYFVALIGCAILAVIITYTLYLHTQSLLRSRLNERLIAIVSTGSRIFEPEEIKFIKENGIKSVGTEIYKNNVLKLQKIRSANKDIMYAYIMGQTAEPLEPIFIIDADAMSIVPTIDFNEDGVVDDLDVTEPGEIYDASEAPALQGPAFESYTVDEELTVDEWGTFLSAYGPIKDDNGDTVGSLTIDVEVTDFMRIVGTTFMPFMLFIVLLLLLLTFLTLYIVRIWRSRVEILREVDRQKDELLSIVSHQLATPVTSVKWYLEMLLDGDSGELTEEQKKQLMTMQGVTEDLVDLVGMILDVSRIQLGRMKVDRADLNLGEFFTEVLAVIEPKVQEKKQKINKCISKTLPVASLDKRLMRMTLENLLSNAVKYTPEGGQVELKVKVEDNVLHYEVRDTGCGIPKEDQEKIFGKLFRATNVRNVDGNGLGLFAAKGAAEAQGGKVWFKSEENKGTTFYVELPIIS
ncbi:MAG: HAMP domain-containing sensor histidine kinase [Candidatus Peregrinibacteria bacterium]